MNLVNLKNDIITYTINKTDASTCYISVQNGEVTVSAPAYLTIAQIQEIVEGKKQWIISKLQNYSKIKNEKIDFEPKSVKVFGKEYPFKVIYKGFKSPVVTLENNNIKIVLPHKLRKTDLSPILKSLIRKLYTTLAENEIELIMEKVRINLGFAPEDYEICEMDGILAKCTSDKKIFINPNIVMFDKETIEYVITHEFTHLKYKNHTKKFYEFLGNYVPNYNKYAKLINKYQY